MTDPSPAAHQARSAPPGIPGLRFLPALVAALAAAWFLGFVPAVARGEVLTWAVPWVPGLGIELAVLIDGLALAFALMITGIGAGVFLYTASYFKGDPRLTRLQALLMLFAVSMLGLVLADDAITLFVFWEGTTVTSFLLIGFDHAKKEARDKALQALLVTGLGGLALLAGLLLLGLETGTFRLSEMALMGDVLRASDLYLGILVLVLLGAFTKSAQFPFHFWLPNAMAAPTPVSAYLHSATMVKAGVYLLARLSPALGGTEVWIWTLTLVGAVTMLLASVWALRQTDLKLMLAYTTVMALGALVMFLGGGHPAAVKAAATFLIVHALYKASLFLLVGVLDKKAGSREVDALRGLAGAMPLTATLTALAALSMAGFPPFLGFIGKELKYEGALAVASEPVFVAGAAVLANALMVACAGLVAVRPFVGRTRRAPKDRPADPPVGMWLPPAVLAVLGLAFGVFPDLLLGRTLIEPIATAILGEPFALTLKLWHGINLPLLLSLLTFALGLTLYLLAPRVRRALAGAEAGGLPAAEGGYDAALSATKGVAAWQTRVIQGGRITVYLRVTFALLALLIWGAVLTGTGPWPAFDIDVPLLHWAIVGLIAVSAVAIVLTRSRLAAICALGAVGAGVAILFVLYGAIDVAMTQLLIEILVVVFIAIALLRLPRIPAGLPRRWGDAALAAALGLGVAVALVAVLGGDLGRELTAYFEANSAPEALGRNIVNVILVDFRALDTLGEIAVVVIAAVAAIAALTARRTKGRRP
ncbi:hydrogen gas-evolving membrane-bound hydrogenase subunit E [Roseospira goensis]|uniref:Multicomponent Na+:H+ antiporter subunit A n=1 Tax=Roseospira goensis TaxID=391922 RepID=A0A7W6RXV3_9PROT|nr:hydrogen gas-evolving membrane-bound hydrogenase subunit E [Roseospira goensis]MBB4285086.1 multicomponent Na+:H+ antiporter subunit A [Roseospira goensis]